MPGNEFSITVSGIKEVNKSLYAYSQQLGDRVVLKALREGAKIVQKDARTRAPRRTGRLRRGIVVKNSKIYSKRRSSNKLGVYLTIRKGKGKSDPRDAFYGRFIENGWRAKGKTLIQGKKFMYGAYLTRRNQALKTIIRASEIGAEIVKRKVGLK